MSLYESYRGYPLSLSEARDFLVDGRLPENFRERVVNFVELDWCSNCDGRKCMGCVFREWYHECADDCPSCCVDAADNGGSDG